MLGLAEEAGVRRLRQQRILHRLVDRQELRRLLRLVNAWQLLVLLFLAFLLLQNLGRYDPEVLLALILHRQGTRGRQRSIFDAVEVVLVIDLKSTLCALERVITGRLV